MGKVIPRQINEPITYGASIKSKNILREIYAENKGRSEAIRAANDVIAVNLALVQADKPDLLSYDSCLEALTVYFNSVCERNSRPTISGISLALGITRAQFHVACETGNVVNNRNGTSICLPTDVYNLFINLRENFIAMLEGFMETGVIHPASGIFLLKNNSDYKDVVEKHYSVTQTTVDVAALAEKYKLESELDAQ